MSNNEQTSTPLTSSSSTSEKSTEEVLVEDIVTPEASATNKKKPMTYQELMEGDDDDDDWIPVVPKELPDWCKGDHPLLMNDIGLDNPIAMALAELRYDGTPDEIATNFKNQGNNLLKDSKNPEMYYKDIIRYYSEGLEQPITDTRLKIDLLNNRSHIFTLMGNYGHAIVDAKEVLKIDNKNTKAMFRIAKAAMTLKKYKPVIKYCQRALKIEGKHALFEDFMKKAEDALLKEQEKKAEEQEKKRQQEQTIQQLKKFLSNRKGIKIGDYTELESEQLNTYTRDGPLGGIQIDEHSGEVFFSVIFAYDEFNQTDFIHTFSEHQTVREQLDMMFPPNGPAFPYGCEKDYVISNLKVFFLDPTSLKNSKNRFIEIKNLNTPLITVLTRSDYQLPSSFIPVLHVVRKNHELEIFK
ncbi:predicted protein [Naegleria gruberi]|uniref:Predicted protein n=1 Tax=Naegleria gruberi TaxID=5762 RepID=D2VA83_NAEGR|nr:uncharacterized protein NAEGRDRAFT_47901 [Naegleria gruberi]EFC46384.1 predicted protein [Naegleria gruberi]|eukprot:XP_002679128.1 predicted protein [Naegleria gruberi strain NEG-M]